MKPDARLASLDWGDTKFVGVPTDNPQFGDWFMGKAGLTGRGTVSKDLDLLRKTFPFDTPPAGVALRERLRKNHAASVRRCRAFSHFEENRLHALDSALRLSALALFLLFTTLNRNSSPEDPHSDDIQSRQSFCVLSFASVLSAAPRLVLTASSVGTVQARAGATDPARSCRHITPARAH